MSGGVDWWTAGGMGYILPLAERSMMIDQNEGGYGVAKCETRLMGKCAVFYVCSARGEVWIRAENVTV